MTVTPYLDRVESELKELADMVDADQPGWTRQAMTETDLAGRQWALKRMREVGLDAHIDEAGNVIGVLKGRRGGRQLMTGSHTDTVEAGGRFDGMIGVVGALEAVRLLKETGQQLDHDLVVVDFFNEEPNRFGLSCVGSRAMTGTLNPQAFGVTDETGTSFAQSLQIAGIEAEAMHRSRWDFSRTDAFVELHIEQGPRLEEMGTEIGMVTSITGVSRFRALFTGRRDHAGTTGMEARVDAGCAAAGTVLAVERIAEQGNSELPGSKGTSGGVRFTPEAINVVTELAEIRGEFRSPQGSWLREAEEQLSSAAAQEAARRGVDVEVAWLPTQDPRPMNDQVVAHCRDAVDQLGLSRAELFSGAEHDAAVIADHVPTAMLFVPSHKGRSHCPEEWTDLGDIQKGIAALTESLIRLDRGGS